MSDPFMSLYLMNVQIHDRAQVFISCPSEEMGARPTYVGIMERWSNNKLSIPNYTCLSNINLYILVYACIVNISFVHALSKLICGS